MAGVLVVGASRGIGLEWVRQARAAGARVVATARDEAGLQRLRELGAVALQLDVSDAASVSGLAWQIDGYQFDEVAVVAGVFGPRTAHIRQLPTEAEFAQVMQTNVLGPMRVVPQLLDALAPQARLALLSSRMGSMGLRSGKGSSLYRASKAALNSYLKDVALELQGRAICLSLHPGWVRTEMGGEDADIDVQTSVAGMRATLAGLSPADNGAFLDYEGQALAW
ncbi:NAD(P)-dependent dehydrogenase (short-subunit alcohol dehydrogenase family) [Paucibacter oligotrophus]|uniref:NAD(P)-dependent dehydrogenase (Short-subunit alcohol dehydrogenase family) n=1 Tax=Roseateles oligotrophus TaxID=1769250 RepID=A0A840LH41_9BURK|nr:SDR family oxidoreductase [Roseateles oligotrophus]MBB4845932.1 NAD(P)-dependent dehydrogenase (short-subunit alcohol dehydrogenase family) [Roseateles oligotrophus]